MTDSQRPLAGRVALVTGANTGIGRETARALAADGARVVLACRSAERAKAAIDDIRARHPDAEVEALALDLGEFASVRAGAERFLARGQALHLLINNAGLSPRRGQRTRSGFELAFGVNHMGHFLLTQLLLPRIRESAPARVITVASGAHFNATGIDWDAVQKPSRSLTGLAEYAQSKLANVLFSAELARRLNGTGVTTYALHPGVVASDIWRGLPRPIAALAKLAMLTPEQGALTTLYCATSREAGGETGLYYDKRRALAPSAPARDAALARELWERSERWITDA